MKIKRSLLKKAGITVKARQDRASSVSTDDHAAPTVNALKVLRDQVRKALATEATMTIENRRLFGWQFVAVNAGENFVVGKTGANTMYYRVGNDASIEPSVCYPDEMLDILDSWVRATYSMYRLMSGKSVVESSTSIDELLELKPKFSPAVIVGVTPKGKEKKMFEYRTALSGALWVKVE